MERASAQKLRSFWSTLERRSQDELSCVSSNNSSAEHSSPSLIYDSPNLNAFNYHQVQQKTSQLSLKGSKIEAPNINIKENIFVQYDQQRKNQFTSPEPGYANLAQANSTGSSSSVPDGQATPYHYPNHYLNPVPSQYQYQQQHLQQHHQHSYQPQVEKPQYVPPIRYHPRPPSSQNVSKKQLVEHAMKQQLSYQRQQQQQQGESLQRQYTQEEYEQQKQLAEQQYADEQYAAEHYAAERYTDEQYAEQQQYDQRYSQQQYDQQQYEQHIQQQIQQMQMEQYHNLQQAPAYYQAQYSGGQQYPNTNYPLSASSLPLPPPPAGASSASLNTTATPPSPSKSALKAVSSYAVDPLNGPRDTQQQQLGKKPSFLRKGSLGRLLGPRSLQSNPKKSKKVVSFVKESPQIIQYEAPSPDISFNSSSNSSQLSSNGSSNADEYHRRYACDDDESNEDENLEPPSARYNGSNDDSQEDDSMSNVPVIEPPEILSPTRMSMQYQQQHQQQRSSDTPFGFHHETTNTIPLLQSGNQQQESATDTDNGSDNAGVSSPRRPLPRLPPGTDQPQSHQRSESGQATSKYPNLFPVLEPAGFQFPNSSSSSASPSPSPTRNRLPHQRHHRSHSKPRNQVEQEQPASEDSHRATSSEPAEVAQEHQDPEQPESTSRNNYAQTRIKQEQEEDEFWNPHQARLPEPSPQSSAQQFSSQEPTPEPLTVQQEAYYAPAVRIKQEPIDSPRQALASPQLSSNESQVYIKQEPVDSPVRQHHAPLSSPQFSSDSQVYIKQEPVDSPVRQQHALLSSPQFSSDSQEYIKQEPADTVSPQHPASPATYSPQPTHEPHIRIKQEPVDEPLPISGHQIHAQRELQRDSPVPDQEQQQQFQLEEHDEYGDQYQYQDQVESHQQNRQDRPQRPRFSFESEAQSEEEEGQQDSHSGNSDAYIKPEPVEETYGFVPVQIPSSTLLSPNPSSPYPSAPSTAPASPVAAERSGAVTPTADTPLRTIIGGENAALREPLDFDTPTKPQQTKLLPRHVSFRDQNSPDLTTGTGEESARSAEQDENDDDDEWQDAEESSKDTSSEEGENDGVNSHGEESTQYALNPMTLPPLSSGTLSRHSSLLESQRQISTRIHVLGSGSPAASLSGAATSTALQPIDETAALSSSQMSVTDRRRSLLDEWKRSSLPGGLPAPDLLREAAAPKQLQNPNEHGDISWSEHNLDGDSNKRRSGLGDLSFEKTPELRALDIPVQDELEPVPEDPKELSAVDSVKSPTSSRETEHESESGSEEESVEGQFSKHTSSEPDVSPQGFGAVSEVIFEQPTEEAFPVTPSNLPSIREHSRDPGHESEQESEPVTTSSYDFSEPASDGELEAAAMAEVEAEQVQDNDYEYDGEETHSNTATAIATSITVATATPISIAESPKSAATKSPEPAEPVESPSLPAVASKPPGEPVESAALAAVASKPPAEPAVVGSKPATETAKSIPKSFSKIFATAVAYATAVSSKSATAAVPAEQPHVPFPSPFAKSTSQDSPASADVPSEHERSVDSSSSTGSPVIPRPVKSPVASESMSRFDFETAPEELVPPSAHFANVATAITTPSITDLASVASSEPPTVIKQEELPAQVIIKQEPVDAASPAEREIPIKKEPTVSIKQEPVEYPPRPRFASPASFPGAPESIASSPALSSIEATSPVLSPPPPIMSIAQPMSINSSTTSLNSVEIKQEYGADTSAGSGKNNLHARQNSWDDIAPALVASLSFTLADEEETARAHSSTFAYRSLDPGSPNPEARFSTQSGASSRSNGKRSSGALELESVLDFDFDSSSESPDLPLPPPPTAPFAAGAKAQVGSKNSENAAAPSKKSVDVVSSRPTSTASVVTGSDTNSVYVTPDEAAASEDESDSSLGGGVPMKTEEHVGGETAVDAAELGKAVSNSGDIDARRHHAEPNIPADLQTECPAARTPANGAATPERCPTTRNSGELQSHHQNGEVEFPRVQLHQPISNQSIPHSNTSETLLPSEKERNDEQNSSESTAQSKEQQQEELAPSNSSVNSPETERAHVTLPASTILSPRADLSTSSLFPPSSTSSLPETSSPTVASEPISPQPHSQLPEIPNSASLSMGDFQLHDTSTSSRSAVGSNILPGCDDASDDDGRFDDTIIQVQKPIGATNAAIGMDLPLPVDVSVKSERVVSRSSIVQQTLDKRASSEALPESAASSNPPPLHTRSLSPLAKPVLARRPTVIKKEVVDVPFIKAEPGTELAQDVTPEPPIPASDTSSESHHSSDQLPPIAANPQASFKFPPSSESEPSTSQFINSAVFEEAQARHRKRREGVPRPSSSPLLGLAPPVIESPPLGSLPEFQEHQPLRIHPDQPASSGLGLGDLAYEDDAEEAYEYEEEEEEEEEEDEEEEDELQDEPSIVATGTNIKTRRSLAPEDVARFSSSNRPQQRASPISSPKFVRDKHRVSSPYNISGGADDLHSPYTRESINSIGNYPMAAAAATAAATSGVYNRPRALSGHSMHSESETPHVPTNILGTTSNTDDVVASPSRLPPPPLLMFNVDDSAFESDSIFGDLDKEFEKMLQDDEITEEELAKYRAEQKPEDRRHGYNVRESRDIIVATSQPKTYSFSNNNTVLVQHSTQHPDLRRKASGHIRNLVSPRLSVTVGNSPATTPITPTYHMYSPQSEETNISSDAVAAQEEGLDALLPASGTHKEPLDHHSVTAHRYRKTSEVFDNDRGRLFIRITGIKNVDGLPGLETKHARVCMVLDNGLHSVTTPYKPLSRKLTPISQEFELTVGGNLEFILTLRAKWPKPVLLAPEPAVQMSRQKSGASSVMSFAGPGAPSPAKRTGFSKLFGRSSKDKGAAGSPSYKTPASKPSTSTLGSITSIRSHSSQISRSLIDSWSNYVAQDGSFGRAYVSFSQFEDDIYGAPKTYDIPCYNEWTVVPSPPGSLRTDDMRSVSGSSQQSSSSLTRRRTPYPIAMLECQMLFIPRGEKSEPLPTSIKDSLAELAFIKQQIELKKQEEMEEKQAEAEAEEKRRERESRGTIVKGNLSQLGGDCKYWRRRYFKLNIGTFTLMAYSETSHKPRVSINLKKAVRVIEDKQTLVEPMTVVSSSSGAKQRRRSAFADHEEGSMFVDEGFRIKFSNGEIIDFYADDGATKRRWIDGLRRVIGAAQAAAEEDEEAKRLQKEKRVQMRHFVVKPWMQQVLANEEELRQMVEDSEPLEGAGQTSKAKDKGKGKSISSLT